MVTTQVVKWLSTGERRLLNWNRRGGEWGKIELTPFLAGLTKSGVVARFILASRLSF